jgi:catechol 2,3-dioxygenase-like lactoylglutathione lyase family enzyme
MYVYAMADFPPITHLALTVTDLDRSVAWYARLFGSDPVAIADDKAYRFAAWLQPSFAVHAFAAASDVDTFSEFRPGLDHVAFTCADRAELELWGGRLDELGIEHGDIVDAWYGSGLSFRDPDNIALEFFAPPARRG